MSVGMKVAERVSVRATHCRVNDRRTALILVIDGDATGKRAAVALGEPTIPPMARTPFSNTLPDYIVTGPEFEAKGYGGVIAAGYFNYKWRVWRAASFLSSDCLRVE